MPTPFTDFNAVYERVRLLLLSNDAAGAVALLRDLVDRCTDATVLDLAQIRLADIMQSQLGLKEEALVEYDAVARREQPAAASAALAQIAFIHEAAGRFDQALQTNYELLSKYPQSASALSALHAVATILQAGVAPAAQQVFQMLDTTLDQHRQDPDPRRRLLADLVDVSRCLAAGDAVRAKSKIESALRHSRACDFAGLTELLEADLRRPHEP